MLVWTTNTAGVASAEKTRDFFKINFSHSVVLLNANVIDKKKLMKQKERKKKELLRLERWWKKATSIEQVHRLRLTLLEMREKWEKQKISFQQTMRRFLAITRVCFYMCFLIDETIIRGFDCFLHHRPGRWLSLSRRRLSCSTSFWLISSVSFLRHELPKNLRDEWLDSSFLSSAFTRPRQCRKRRLTVIKEISCSSMKSHLIMCSHYDESKSNQNFTNFSIWFTTLFFSPTSLRIPLPSSSRSVLMQLLKKRVPSDGIQMKII